MNSSTKWSSATGGHGDRAMEGEADGLAEQGEWAARSLAKVVRPANEALCDLNPPRPQIKTQATYLWRRASHSHWD